MALLHAAALLAPKRTWQLTLAAAHIQHHLRPDDQAEGDAHAVAMAAHRLGIPYLRADVEVRSHSGNIESLARRARYDALLKLAKSFGASAIATAHHADDQLETLLMRMLRGASLRGLSAIPWRRREGECVLLRPMLHHTRIDAESFLRDIGQPWRTDATNADVSRTRAKLRREVTPVLTSIAPRAALRGAQAADELRRLARMERAAVALAMRVAVTHTNNKTTIDRAEARSLPASLLSSLLRECLVASGVPGGRITRALLTRIVRATRDEKGGSRRFECAGNRAVNVTRSAVIIEAVK